MLEKVRTALRIKTNALDGEILDNIAAAKMDLGVAGVFAPQDDPLITRAIITFCRCNMGRAEDYERLKKSYDEQKGQLQTATGYTEWMPGEDGRCAE